MMHGMEVLAGMMFFFIKESTVLVQHHIANSNHFLPTLVDIASLSSVNET